jgi:hypothetical protein
VVDEGRRAKVLEEVLADLGPSDGSVVSLLYNKMSMV